MKRVTLVDDDCGVRESLRQLYKRDDLFTVLSEHARAKDANKQLTYTPPDQQPHLVLLDIAMPGMDGIECCGELRQRFPDLVIAMFTARRLPCYAQAARLAGADAYFCKSMEPGPLLAELAGLHRTECMLLGGNMLLGGETGRFRLVSDPRLKWREEQVLELEAEGLAMGEVSAELKLHEQTIYRIRHAARERLQNSQESA